MKPARARHPRRRGALLAAALATSALAGCGNEIPPNSVAAVDGTPIERASYERWLGTVARAQQQQVPGAPPTPVTVPDPPNYDRCVAAKRAQGVPRGRALPPVAQTRQQCRGEYESLKQRVMQFLINAQWIEQEAEERDVEVEEAEVRRSFDDQKRRAFPDDAQYRQFLTQSGQTEEDILYRVRLDMLVNEVQRNVVESRGEVSEPEVRDYYNRNRARFGQPERRELIVILADDEAQARRVRRLLNDRQPIERLVQRYSIDESSKRQGGRLTVARNGQQDRALEQAAFRARPGQVVGPVNTDFGSYVFRLERAVPASQQTLPQATEQIRQILRGQKEQRALEEFVRDFERRHKEETLCAPGYVVAECRNGPPTPRPQPGGPPGAQGQPPPGAQGEPPPGSQGEPPPGGQGAPAEPPPGQGGSNSGPEGGE